MARPRLDLLGAILLVVAALWLAPGLGGARADFGPGAAEIDDVLSSRMAATAQAVLAESPGDDPDDENPDLDGASGLPPRSGAGSARPGPAALPALRRIAPRATGPPV